MNTHKAKYAKQQTDQTVRCLLCPRQCVLGEGERGFCFIRKNICGILMATAYGQISGLSADPIEKKPLYHFLPGTKTLSFGSIGCNLGCRFCQNWQLSRAQSEHYSEKQEVSALQIAETAKANNCASVAFTYNEPVINFEFILDTARQCREAGLKTVLVSSGYINPEPAKELFPYIDAANIDLKAFTEFFYKKFCAGSLRPVLNTLKYLVTETKVWTEITNLIIPGENDSTDEINAMTQWIGEELGNHVPMHFSAFHPAYQINDKNRTPARTLFNAVELAHNNGLKYVYTGNIEDQTHSATNCPKCGKIAIQRNGFVVTEQNITDQGLCGFCRAPLDGYFLTDKGTS